MKRIQQMLLLLVAVFSTNLYGQHNDAVKNYIDQYGALAIAEMQRSGVPASIKLAQGIHETGAGNSDLVKRSNNHFGIKCKSNWAGATVYHDDDERGECFRSYGSPLDSYKDHSDFLRKSARYEFLFSLDPEDYRGWAFGLKKAGYATNIRYSHILINLIEKYDLQQYTLIALGKQEAGSVHWASVIEEPKLAPITEAAREKIDGQASSSYSPHKAYPAGVFVINNTRVIFAPAGSSLRELAKSQGLSLERLLEFNELASQDRLVNDQLIYLQRKRKTGSSRYHQLEAGQSLYDVSQLTAVRLQSLLEYNHLQKDMPVAEGQLIYLQHKAAVRPLLHSEKATVSGKQADPVDFLASLVPAKHIVQSKETLYSISKKYGVNIDQLKSWNQLPGHDLKVGQELLIHKN